MRVLVTGANGHVGSNLVRELLGRGVDVVPMVRPSSNPEGLLGLGLPLAKGDVLDPASLEAAARGCDVIVNLAAVFKTRAPTAEEIMEPAVTGVRNVLTVAARLGVKKVIHTSSIVAVGLGASPESTRSEADWNDRPHLPYYRAKTESERLAWSLAAELKVPLAVLCPGAITGRYDYRVTPSTRYLQRLASGTAMSAVGGINYVDVRDVALAHALAIDKAEPGQRYIIGGENLTFRRLGELVQAEAGTPVRHFGGPRWLVLALTRAQELATRAFGKEPEDTVAEFDEVIGRFGFVDSRKAELALGYTPRKGEEMVRDTLRWLAFRDALPPEVLTRLREKLPAEAGWAKAA